MEIKKASEVLKKGGVIIFPTETLYGIGCVALNSQGVKKIYEIKKRSYEKELPVIIGDMKQLFILIEDTRAQLIDFIMNNLWPGPVSILFKGKENLPKGVLSREGFVCVRLTSNNTAQKICVECGYPIVATSANISGFAPPRSLEDIDKSIIEKCDFVIKGGQRPTGKKPSTIIKFLDEKNVRILRDGAYPSTRFLELGLNIVK